MRRTVFRRDLAPAPASGVIPGNVMTKQLWDHIVEGMSNRERDRVYVVARRTATMAEVAAAVGVTNPNGFSAGDTHFQADTRMADTDVYDDDGEVLNIEELYYEGGPETHDMSGVNFENRVWVSAAPYFNLKVYYMDDERGVGYLRAAVNLQVATKSSLEQVLHLDGGKLFYAGRDFAGSVAQFHAALRRPVPDDVRFLGTWSDDTRYYERATNLMYLPNDVVSRLFLAEAEAARQPRVDQSPPDNEREDDEDAYEDAYEEDNAQYNSPPAVEPEAAPVVRPRAPSDIDFTRIVEPQAYVTVLSTDEDMRYKRVDVLSRLSARSVNIVVPQDITVGELAAVLRVKDAYGFIGETEDDKEIPMLPATRLHGSSTDTLVYITGDDPHPPFVHAKLPTLYMGKHAVMLRVVELGTGRYFLALCNTGRTLSHVEADLGLHTPGHWTRPVLDARGNVSASRTKHNTPIDSTTTLRSLNLPDNAMVVFVHDPEPLDLVSAFGGAPRRSRTQQSRRRSHAVPKRETSRLHHKPARRHLTKTKTRTRTKTKTTKARKSRSRKSRQRRSSHKRRHG